MNFYTCLYEFFVNLYIVVNRAFLINAFIFLFFEKHVVRHFNIFILSSDHYEESYYDSEYLFGYI